MPRKQPRFSPSPNLEAHRNRVAMRPPVLGGRSKKDQLGSVAESWGTVPERVYGMFQIEADPPSRSTSSFNDEGVDDADDTTPTTTLGLQSRLGHTDFDHTSVTARTDLPVDENRRKTRAEVRLAREVAWRLARAGTAYESPPGPTSSTGRMLTPASGNIRGVSRRTYDDDAEHPYRYSQSAHRIRERRSHRDDNPPYAGGSTRSREVARQASTPSPCSPSPTPAPTPSPDQPNPPCSILATSPIALIPGSNPDSSSPISYSPITSPPDTSPLTTHSATSQASPESSQSTSHPRRSLRGDFERLRQRSRSASGRTGLSGRSTRQ